GVQRLLFLGSSCIYPKLAVQPIAESSLLTGYLEPTNEPYAIAKIAGIKLCESYNRQYGCDFRSVMPANLYGPGDNFHKEDSHVIPALIRRFHEAKLLGLKEVVVWGSGSAMREFLHVDDLAAGALHVMSIDQGAYQKNTLPSQSHINIGTGVDYSIKELVKLIVEITAFEGRIVWDNSMPDGAPRKLLNLELITKLGWRAKIQLKQGLIDTYRWYVDNLDRTRN
ncbi:NAD-dependent epimerase/dehydratase family protein, partial [Alphaproteobacteria bacterium]|nr:NAD-dependent epimerase/dehydratase family protein [Alphaproteobacteria bacterium]